MEGFWSTQGNPATRPLDAPIRLAELGVTPDKLSDIARRGTGRSTAWNPRPMAERDVLHVCEMVL